LLPKTPWRKSPDIELVALTKRYGDTVAVDSINLKIPGPVLLLLLGPSGCGKTTTLRMIAGHEDASDGDVILGSENITHLPPAARGTAMNVPELRALSPSRLHRQCRFSLKMRGVDKDTRAPGAPAPERVQMEPSPSACRRSSRAASNSAWRWHAP